MTARTVLPVTTRRLHVRARLAAELLSAAL